jgi:hypothetical protein
MRHVVALVSLKRSFYLAGNPAVVFDCIYHSSFKSHVLKDADVKKLLIGKFRRHSCKLVVSIKWPRFCKRVGSSPPTV